MDVKYWSGRVVVLALTGLMVISSPAIVMSQQDADSVNVAEPTDEQLRLNAEAVSAIQDEEYTRAIELLDASNALGEMNVTWLNLGRAYQRLDQCQKARDAYLNVITSPAVKDPSPRLINAKADQYLSELEEDCDVADEVAPEMAASADPVEPAAPAAQPTAEPSNALGWTLTASGLVIAGAGVGAHFWAESIRDDVTTSIDAADGRVVSDINRQQALDQESQANTLDTVGVSAIAVGAIATGTGVYLLLTTDDVEAQPSASISAGGDVSIGLTGRF